MFHTPGTSLGTVLLEQLLASTGSAKYVTYATQQTVIAFQMSSLKKDSKHVILANF